MPQRPEHIMSWEALEALRPVSPQQPLRILLSACLTRRACLFDGNGLGHDDFFHELLALPTVKAIPFCPEDFSFGTPRALSDIYGGNGFDVLDGRARVLTTAGADWTGPMLAAAERMLALAQKYGAELAILLDMSAACGVQVISDGSRAAPERLYQRGPGLCAALLIRHGIPVLSQRDERSLQVLRAQLEPGYCVEPAARDFHEQAWYRGYFS